MELLGIKIRIMMKYWGLNEMDRALWPDTETGLGEI